MPRIKRRKPELAEFERQKHAPADNYVESDIRLRGKITLVSVKIRRYADDVPRAALPVVGQIDEVLVVVKREWDLIAVEGPRAEFHDAGLLIEGEVRHVDRARALIDRWRHPEHFAVRVNQHVAFVANLVIAIGAANDDISVRIEDKINIVLQLIKRKSHFDRSIEAEAPEDQKKK